RRVLRQAEVRRGLLQRDEDRQRSRHESRFLVQLRQRARVEPAAAVARDGVGEADRRADDEADRVARRARAPPAVRRGAESVRRAPADGLFRRAAHLRRVLVARPERRARSGPSSALVAAGSGRVRPLTRYLARRLAFAALLVVCVSSASFLLARLAPGDFFTQQFGEANAETIARGRLRFGLDKSIPAQYVGWLASAVRLDFGDSMLYDRPVRGLIAERAA